MRGREMKISPEYLVNLKYSLPFPQPGPTRWNLLQAWKSLDGAPGEDAFVRCPTLDASKLGFPMRLIDVEPISDRGRDTASVH